MNCLGDTVKFCPNCGNKLDDNSQFCSNCGKSINKTQSNRKLNDTGNFEIDKIIDFVKSNPKLVGVAFILLIVILSSAMFSSNEDSTDQNYSDVSGSEMTIFGVVFNIPEGFEESYHSGPFSGSGETVDFQSDDYDDLEISVSSKHHVDLSSNHIKVKYSKTISGKEGTLVFYDSNRISFYYDEGDYTIKLNTNSPDYEDLFGSVII